MVNRPAVAGRWRFVSRQSMGKWQFVYASAALHWTRFSFGALGPPFKAGGPSVDRKGMGPDALWPLLCQGQACGRGGGVWGRRVIGSGACHVRMRRC